MIEDFAAEFYGLPTYFITTARTEIVGPNVRVYHWERRGTILAPQFIAVLTAYDLATISKDVQDTAAQGLLEHIPWGARGH